MRRMESVTPTSRAATGFSANARGSPRRLGDRDSGKGRRQRRLGEDSTASRVEDVPQSVSEKTERQHGHEAGGSGGENRPWVAQQVGLIPENHVSPLGAVEGHSDADKVTRRGGQQHRPYV